MDFHSLKDVTDLFAGHQVLLAALVEYEFNQMIPNAWMASAQRRHPFWMFCIKKIVERATL